MEKTARESFDRETFETPREVEYFNARELTMLTGQPEDRFAAVLQKEIADNGLDGAESKGVAPELTIEVFETGGSITISVTDNGPGIAPEVIDKALDYSVRASDKAAYPSPSRGAQGNAFKCIFAIPYALGGKDPIIIEAVGVRHEIRAWLDPANELRIIHNKLESARKAGTAVTVTIPAGDQDYDPGWWARAISIFNPHAVVKVKVSGATHNHARNDSPVFAETYNPLVQFPAEWNKWVPTDSIPAHWYSNDAFQRLIFSHLASSRKTGRPDHALGEFVRQFRGIKSTAKAREIAKLFPEIRRLSDFESCPEKTSELLAQLQARSKPVPARALGLIGEDAFRQRFDELYGLRRLWYGKLFGEADGMPYVLEAALAETAAEAESCYFGLNFSPTFSDPLIETRIQLQKDLVGWGLLGLLEAAHVNDFSFAFAFHLVSPRLTFRDRGKSGIAVGPELKSALVKVLWPVLKTPYQEGKRRNRSHATPSYDEPSTDRPVEVSVKEAVFAVMDEGWTHTTASGEFPASVRMLFYSVRKLIQQHTRKELDFNYFSQDLVIQWKQTRGPLEGIYFDPRGVLHEPHGGRTLLLGTREVAAYHLPDHVFDKILYIEKKGLLPVFEAAQIGERFDMATIAGEGYATEAARMLFKRAQKGHYRLFVLHDSDPDGYNIARTLAEETRRMPGYSVEVMDLGLRLEEGLELGLQSETFIRKRALHANLVLNKVERRYFEGVPKGRNYWECQRIELNAFTSPGLITFLERKLVESGVAPKLIPPAELLETFSRQAYSRELDSWATVRVLELLGFAQIAARIRDTFNTRVRTLSRDKLATLLTENRVFSWRHAVESQIENKLSEHQSNLVDALRKEIFEQAAEMSKSREPET